MKIPEIERSLKNVDPKIRFWFKHHQEQLLAIQAQLDQVAELLVRFYEVLENLHQVSNADQKALDKLNRKEPDGIVKSVLNEPEDD